MTELYDSIGHGYRARRQPDPRIGERIRAALASAASVVNVGAGTGSYEPADRTVVAVEPSQVMLRQRPGNRAPAVCATASQLPFRDRSFDAALAVLTIHHWPDLGRGLRELRRVARANVVILTVDPDFGGFWLNDYFPEMALLDRRSMPSLAVLRQHLGSIVVQPVPVPHDCVDGFWGAYWRRPHAYLEDDVRAAISVFSQIGELDAGLSALRADLDSGAWHARHRDLLDRDVLDVGYRLVIA